MKPAYLIIIDVFLDKNTRYICGTVNDAKLINRMEINLYSIAFNK